MKKIFVLAIAILFAATASAQLVEPKYYESKEEIVKGCQKSAARYTLSDPFTGQTMTDETGKCISFPVYLSEDGVMFYVEEQKVGNRNMFNRVIIARETENGMIYYNRKTPTNDR